MSGIAGLFFTDGRPVERLALEGMLAAIPHRGPCHAGLWKERAVGFGNRALPTTPEAVDEEAPFFDPVRNLAITADARVDNRADLLAELGMADRPPLEIPDSQIILHAYEKWEEKCPEKILGDFAFAIWDGRRHRLFCARDPFGVCPFFYYQSQGLFAFASEIKALLALPDLPRRLNEHHLLEYLVSSFDNEAATFYEGILALPAAHQISIGDSSHSLRRYWALDPSRELRLGSDAEYAESFREIFREAVRCRMRSAGPVGAMLSGGLDSSSIACTAAQFSQSAGGVPLPTFSLVFEDVPQCDESAYRKAAFASAPMEPHFLHGDRIGPFFEIERVLRHQDEPFQAGNLFLHWAMYRAASEAGVSVLLDGIDGDTTVSHGLYRLVEMARAGRWPSVIQEARHLGVRHGVSTAGVLRGIVALPLIPPALRQAWRTARGRHSPLASLDIALNPDFQKRTHFAERAPALLGTGRGLLRTERAEHYRRLTRGILSFVLGVADRASAAFSLQVRYPFFDRRLVEFCLSLPAEQKLRNGWSRWVMRQAMEGTLPPEIQWRGGKSNLEPNFLYTLRTHDLERMRQILREDGDLISPYVELAPIQASLEEFAAHGTWRAASPVMRTLMLALWLRQSQLAP